MEFAYTFDQLKPSEAMKFYAEKRLAEQLGDRLPSDAHVRFDFTQNGNLASVQCWIVAQDGLNVTALDSSVNVFNSIGRIIDKLDDELERRSKRRLFGVRRLPRYSPIPVGHALAKPRASKLDGTDGMKLSS